MSAKCRWPSFPGDIEISNIYKTIIHVQQSQQSNEMYLHKGRKAWAWSPAKYHLCRTFCVYSTLVPYKFTIYPRTMVVLQVQRMVTPVNLRGPSILNWRLKTTLCQSILQIPAMKDNGKACKENSRYHRIRKTSNQQHTIWNKPISDPIYKRQLFRSSQTA